MRGTNNRNCDYRENKWHQITNEEAYQLTGSTESKGSVYQYSIDNLLSSIRDNMPGIKEVYVSQFITCSLSSDDVSVSGEFVVGRVDSFKETYINKGYVYLFGTSGSCLYFCGPYKPRGGHHFDGEIPLDELLNKVKIKPKNISL